MPWKAKPEAVYLCDNGECLCGDHLGASARFTGRDISGQPILEITPDLLREVPTVACETCGRKPSTLYLP